MSIPFNVSMTLENRSVDEQVVSIPRGTIVEADSSHLAYQSAVVQRDYVFTLNPGEVRTVILEAQCWNRHLAPPHSIPGKVTPLKAATSKTTDAWSVSSSPAAHTVLTSTASPNSLEGALIEADPTFATEFRKACQGAQTASELRAFLIKRQVSSGVDSSLMRSIATIVYTKTSHRFASEFNRLALELADLDEQAKYTIDPSGKDDLKKLARLKYQDILDSLPQLDSIKW